jgi:hypothetical protein
VALEMMKGRVLASRNELASETAVAAAAAMSDPVPTPPDVESPSSGRGSLLSTVPLAFYPGVEVRLNSTAQSLRSTLSA